ncbi:MAG: glycosyltransferase family 39 protein [Acidobacteria bacterium]|nr:glycosyltransferase family 39 protein [Acidobacteriota bacterium]MCB9396288.1 glycosyltransferase family 39 protein [Acidobacteriota bacterium]
MNYFIDEDPILKPSFALPVLVVCFLVSLIFLTKPPSNDDIVFLEYAQQMAFQPLATAPQDYVFHGMVLKNFVVFESTHPPLIPYMIKIALALFGNRMWPIHLMFAPFLMLATLSLADLIARKTKQSPYLALALTMGPLFLPQASSIMTDFPLLAFFLGAWAAWERTLETDRSQWFWWTLVFSVGATFTAYQGLAIFPVLLIRGLGERKIARTLVLIGLSLVPIAVWLGLVYRIYHLFPFFIEPRPELSVRGEVLRGMTGVAQKSMALFLYVGASLMSFLAVWLWQQRGRAILYGLGAAAGWGLFLAQRFLEHGSFYWAACLAGFGVLSVPVLAQFLINTAQPDETRSTKLSLMVTLIAFCLFQLVLAPFASPRYVLILIAALYVILLWNLQTLAKPLAVLCALFNIGLGLLVGVAERQYAGAQRIDLLDLPVEQTIHFVGEMGVKYSGEKRGYHYYYEGLNETVNYLLVAEGLDHTGIPSHLLEAADPIKRFSVSSSWPVMVDNPEQGTSLYIHPRGLLPFSWGSSEIASFTLYRCYRPVLPDWGREPQQFEPVGMILPERPFTYEVTCKQDGISKMDIYFATFARQNTCQMLVLVEQIDPLSGESLAEIARFHFTAESLEDNQYRSFSFASQNSAGKTYRITIKSPNAEATNSVTLWSNAAQDETYAMGTLQQKGQPGIRLWAGP